MNEYIENIFDNAKSYEDYLKSYEEYIELVRCCIAYKTVPAEIYVIEETAELSKECTKRLRNKFNKDHMQDEVADVLNSVFMLCIENKLDMSTISLIMKQKLERLFERAKNGEN